MSTQNSNNIYSILAKAPSMLIKAKESGIISPKTLLTIYRAKVLEAYQNRKIFTVFGNYGSIRQALLDRGWLEKLSPNRFANLQNQKEDELLENVKRGNDYETVVISKIINHFPAFFVWQGKGIRDLYAKEQPYRSCIRLAEHLDFSTKVGFIGCAEHQQCFRQEGISGMIFPRFFRLGTNQEDQAAFVEDFRKTQCHSLLRYLIRHANKLEDIIDFGNGTISPSIIRFAIERVRRQMDSWNDIEDEPTEILDEEWIDFVNNSSRVINEHQKLKCYSRDLLEFVQIAKSLIKTIELRRPDYKWDDYKNLWILKPGYMCRGSGIVVRNNIDDILAWSASHVNQRYIVQKYIEKPLLIYRTKFDIRQYMLLVIRESVIQIWLYKDCYFKISSEEYDIDDLREIIHLTNFTVQKKYKSNSNRDPRLPKNHMWSLDQFKAYMKSQNMPDHMWESRVFAGFCENVIAVVMASINEANLCENSFELYGCDFMLDQEYKPILIEVNSTPDMTPSTDITARLCRMVLNDCVKVIVDLPLNSRASTGLFRKIYEVNYKFKEDSNISKSGLQICGKSMELCKQDPNSLKRKIKSDNKVRDVSKSNSKSKTIAAKLSKVY